MNFPTPSSHSSFNTLIEADNLHYADAKNTENALEINFDEFDLNLIDYLINDIHIEEKPQPEKNDNIEAIIESYEKEIHNISIQNKQNPDIFNLDFEKMDLSEIDQEIEKTKEAIKVNEQAYQQKIQELQEMKEASETVKLLKRKAIALYNEMVIWSKNMIEAKYPHVNPQKNLPDSINVFQNSTTNPDLISEQIHVYYKDIKKQIKEK